MADLLICVSSYFNPFKYTLSLQSRAYVAALPDLPLITCSFEGIDAVAIRNV
jgi:hypothetical protein